MVVAAEAAGVGVRPTDGTMEKARAGGAGVSRMQGGDTYYSAKYAYYPMSTTGHGTRHGILM